MWLRIEKHIDADKEKFQKILQTFRRAFNGENNTFFMPRGWVMDVEGLQSGRVNVTWYKEYDNSFIELCNAMCVSFAVAGLYTVVVGDDAHIETEHLDESNIRLADKE